MKYIKLFEEFEEPKQEPMMQRLARGTRKFLNIDKKEDRETIEKIHRMIDSEVEFVKSVVEIKPDVYIIYLNNGNVTLDYNNKTISYNGEQLQLKDIDDECEKLYDILRPQFRKYLPKIEYDIVKSNRTKEIPPYGQ